MSEAEVDDLPHNLQLLMALQRGDLDGAIAIWYYRFACIHPANA